MLTVSNRLSLVTLKSAEFTLCSGSFKWGEGGYCLLAVGPPSPSPLLDGTLLSLLFFSSMILVLALHLVLHKMLPPVYHQAVNRKEMVVLYSALQSIAA